MRRNKKRFHCVEKCHRHSSRREYQTFNITYAGAGSVLGSRIACHHFLRFPIIVLMDEIFRLDFNSLKLRTLSKWMEWFAGARTRWQPNGERWIRKIWSRVCRCVGIGDGRRRERLKALSDVTITVQERRVAGGLLLFYFFFISFRLSVYNLLSSQHKDWASQSVDGKRTNGIKTSMILLKSMHWKRKHDSSRFYFILFFSVFLVPDRSDHDGKEDENKAARHHDTTHLSSHSNSHEKVRWPVALASDDSPDWISFDYWISSIDIGFVATHLTEQQCKMRLLFLGFGGGFGCRRKYHKWLSSFVLDFQFAFGVGSSLHRGDGSHQTSWAHSSLREMNR